jgi:hypothetical protein
MSDTLREIKGLEGLRKGALLPQGRRHASLSATAKELHVQIGPK